MINKQSPIGIFDSGLGGLTVVKAVQEILPNESIIYFGDTARVPYGIKSEKIIRSYALEITDFLLKKKVKLILIACNTVSASARELIEAATGPVPVLDVISAGTRAALRFPNHQCIGVIGTLATIGSGAYERAINKQNENVKVISESCPLLVPLAEEGWFENPVAEQVLQHYLQRFEDNKIDSLILGCTHYPLFKPVIKKILHDPEIALIDSAETIAKTTRRILKANKLLNDGINPWLTCYVSDRPQRFQKLAKQFLGKKIDEVLITRE